MRKEKGRQALDVVRTDGIYTPEDFVHNNSDQVKSQSFCQVFFGRNAEAPLRSGPGKGLYFLLI
jgi:hypothetical protein